MSLYRGMDAEELEIAYSPSSVIGGDYEWYIDRYRVESAEARRLLPAKLDLAYGDQPGQTLDLFQTAKPDKPLHIFVHGGYWQELSAKESAVMARALIANDISLAVINYSLAPDASIDQMIDECYQAVCYLLQQGNALGIDPTNVSLSGHSAGAQLIWMMLSRCQGDTLLDAIESVILISGIYDLVPLCWTTINEPLGLTLDTAHGLSPAHNAVVPAIPSAVVMAEHDTQEFRRQAKEFYHKLLAAEVPSHFIEVKGCNHFDIILDLDTTNRLVLESITESFRAGNT